MGSVLTMWPPMSSPFTNIIIAPKSILGAAQAKVVTNSGELSNDDDIS
jgi:hypothetical protein